MRPALSGLVLLLGCAPHPPPPSASAAAPTPPKAQAPETPVLTRVVATARFSQAERFAGLLDEGESLPARLLPNDLAWAAAVASPSLELAIWALLDTSTPSGLSLAYGMTVSSAERAASAAGAAGYRVDAGARRFLAPDLSARRSCQLARLGPAEWLLCADGAGGLARVSQALAEATASPVNGLQIELAPQLIAASMGPELTTRLAPVMASLLGIESRNARFDEASGELIRALATEAAAVLSDLDTAELRVQPASADMTHALEARLHFTGRSSWTSELLQSPTPRPPEQFWALPETASEAWFFQGLPAARYEAARTSMVRLLYELLDYQGTPLLLRERATALLRATPLPTLPLVYAHGAVESTAKQAVSAEFQRDLGVHLLGLAEPPDRVVRFLDDWAGAYRDDVLGSQLRRVLRAFDERLVPLGIKRKPGVLGQLPAGTLAWELQMPGRRIDPRQGRFVVDRAAPEAMLVFVATKGAQTWIAWSGNAAKTRERLLAVLRPSPTLRSLRDSPRLSGFKAEGALFGGLHGDGLLQLLTSDQARRELRWTATVPAARLRALLSRASP